ncbi:MAG: efflux RND transporter permease subunit [Candidatus Omnitrophota bacterium]
MRLPEFSVKRPVTISMFFLGALVLGFISLTRLPRELFPSITYPQLTVITTYENAAPEEVETLITKIIEEAVGTVSNLKRISSISKEGVSIVSTEFGWGTNMDFASLGIREKIDLVQERLPLGSSDPIVMKFNPFDLPVMTLSITGNKSPSELLRLSRKFIKDEIEKVEGVASCNISGGVEREILVSVDEGRLRASNISITSIVDALSSSNLNYPAGTIEEHFYEYLIRTMGEFKIVPEIRKTVVGKDEPIEEARLRKPGWPEPEPDSIPRLIYLKDIAEIKDTFQERTSISRYNGEENISIAVQKQAGVNTLLVAQKVRARLGEIGRDLPKGMDVKIVYDQSIFIKQSIRGVMDAAVQGGILAFLVLFIFLRNIKASLIVAVSMPISIMVAFSLMYFNGITLNMLSLGGLALGIGMLVDNAIVVIENIYNNFSENRNIKEASISGASEMSGAIFSSTLTTVAVFLPMVFVVGVAGQLFKELAFTVTFSLLASLIMALSLIPRLTAIGGRAIGKIQDIPKSNFTLGLGPLYSKLIPRILRHRVIFLIAVMILLLSSSGVFMLLDREFMPRVDQREFIIKVNMPSGTKLAVTDRVTAKIEKVLFNTKAVEGAAVNIGSSKKKDYAQDVETIGSNQAQILVALKKGGKEKATSNVIDTLKDRLDKTDLEDAEIEYVLQESVFKTALQGSAPVVIEIKGKDLNKIEELAGYVKGGLSHIKGIYGIRTSLTKPSPETKVNVLKDKAALYNLSTSVIAQAAHTAIKGTVATKFKEEGREIDVRVRLRKEGRSRFSSLRNILVHSPLGIEVPLSEIAYITQGVGPSEIKRLDQQRVVLVTANIADRALDKVITDIGLLLNRIEKEEAGRPIGLKDTEKDVNMAISGENQQMKESFKSLRFALLLSILLVYMIMAAQFESLWQPFVIMFAVPLSLTGVFVALFITHTPISVVVMLGLIMLGGIVVNTGIILIDSINRLREKGVELIEAVIEAGKIRLRPILMTTMTTLLGLLPLAMGMAEGSKLQSPMAITVMGGLLASTILMLFVVPCVYTIIAEIIAKRLATETPCPSRIPGPQPILELLRKEPKVVSPSSLVTKPEQPEIEPVETKIKPLIIKKAQEESEVKPPPEPTPSPKPEPLPESVPSPEPVPPPKLVPSPEPVPSLEPEPSKLLVPEETPAFLPMFNKRQEQLIEYLKKVKRITRKEYARQFNVSVPTAARDLKELLDKGILIANGPLGPGRWYGLQKTEDRGQTHESS